MKNHKDIIAGIFIGIIVFCALIFVKPMIEEYKMRADAEGGPSSGGSSAVLSSINNDKFKNPHFRFDFDDVFGSSVYQNLYLFIYQFVLVDPEDNALKEVAKKYGLTINEAGSVRDGSVEPLLKKMQTGWSQQQLFDMANKLRADFNDMYDLYSLQQDLTFASAGSELFSNGDVSDSGFDLVYDLDLMEEILFNESTPPSVGGPLDLGKLFKKGEVEEAKPKSPSIDPSIPPVYNTLTPVDKEEVTTSTGEKIIDEKPATATGEKEKLDPTKLVEVTKEDVCPKAESPLEKAMAAYEEQAKKDAEAKAGNNTTGSEGEGTGEEPKEKPTPGVLAPGDSPDSLSTKVLPEPPDDWYRKLNCGGELFLSGSGSASKNGISLGAADYYICLEFKTIWETYSSYVPKTPCIKCELDKILNYMQKTLSNSMTPNKVTGGYMESSKCSKSMTSIPLNLQIQIIWAPALTPPNDDAIYGKNVISEWNKFVSRQNPFALKDIGVSLLVENQAKTATDSASQNAGPNSTLFDLVNETSQIQESLAKQQADAVEQYEISTQGENFVIYAQSVMEEIGQMQKFFENYTEMFKTILTKSCPSLIGKPYAD